MGSVGNGDSIYLNAIKSKYSNAVIGEFKDGKVTFQYKEGGKEYEYKAQNIRELAERLNAKVGRGLEGNSFFGNTTQTSNDYFKMEKQVQGDTIAFATNNIKVSNGSPMLIVSPTEAIYLKDHQYEGVGIKNNGSYTGDSIMVKLTKNEFESAKRYTYKNGFGDIALSKTETFEDFKKTALAQQKGKNTYKRYRIAVYNNRIDTSVGKKGRRIV